MKDFTNFMYNVRELYPNVVCKVIADNFGSDDYPTWRFGWHIIHPNGKILSVQVGTGNYCNRADSFELAYTAKNAEIAFLRPDGSFARLSSDWNADVLGYVSPEDCLLWLIEWFG